jgi:hypothetical protein
LFALEGIPMTTAPVGLDALVTRLEYLEKQNRRLKQVGLVALIVFGAFVLMGGQEKAKSQVTDGEKFVLRDPNGKDRAWLGMGKNGPGLHFLDENGAERAGMEMMKEGMALRLLDGKGKLMTGLSVERSGVAVVAIDENNRLFVGANALKTDAGLFSPSPRR